MKNQIEEILKTNFQDNFEIKIDYTANEKEEIYSIGWVDGTTCSEVEKLLQSKIKNTRMIFCFRRLSNNYIIEKLKLLTKEFKFLENTLKKIKEEDKKGVIFSSYNSSSYNLVNKIIKQKFKHFSLFKDKRPESVACLINAYFEY